jgi:hypothetical protein
LFSNSIVQNASFIFRRLADFNVINQHLPISRKICPPLPWDMAPSLKLSLVAEAFGEGLSESERKSYCIVHMLSAQSSILQSGFLSHLKQNKFS